MPASTATIYNVIANAAHAEAALAELTPNPDSAAQLAADLNSGSKASIHRLFMWLTAYLMKLQRDLFDRHKVEVIALGKDGHFGTRRWFAAKALAFQYGHTLVLTNLDARYAVDDPAARIVTHAAVIEAANRVLVKVAKDAGTGLAKLTPDELLAVNDYFQEMRPPVQVQVLTADPDKLRMYGAVIYDAETPLAGTQSAVNTAIATYLKTLEFGGVMRLTDLKAAMLQVSGVVDVRFDRVEARTTGLWGNISRIYTSYAGHMVLDAGHPITSTLAWQAGTV